MVRRLMVVVALVGFYAIHPLIGLVALAGVTVLGIRMRKSVSI